MTVFDKVMLSDDINLKLEYQSLTLDHMQQYQEDQWEEIRKRSLERRF